MKYISVCSGIEAATSAWHHLGWEPVAFSEIEPFPSAVLKHHYPNVPNWGDMTKYQTWPDATIDLLVGGTPCQSFSIAGLRKGLEDPRGNLMLTFLGIAQRYRPKYIVWENVPGVLSSNGGRDFGAFLGALGELGYGWAYRVLDAQWFGVAQRRRRVFVVGCLGDQASAAAVLFESESVCRYFEKSGKARQGAARGVGGGPAGGGVPDVAQTLSSRDHKGPSCGRDWLVGNPIAVAQPVANTLGNRGLRSHTELDGHGAYIPVTFAKTHKPMSATDAEGWSPVDAAPTVTHWPRDRSDAGTDVAVVYERHDQDARVKEVSVAPTLHSKSDNTCDLPMVMQPVAFHPTQDPINSVDVCHALSGGSKQGTASAAVAHPAAIAFKVRGGVEREDGSRGSTNIGKQAGKGYLGSDELAFTVASSPDQYLAQPAMQVRRLTPTECERLQGFPDGWTNIPWRGKAEAPDGPRYKALGNSMAVPVMRWIGERINE